jgi:hypothetical protein
LFRRLPTQRTLSSTLRAPETSQQPPGARPKTPTLESLDTDHERESI